MGLMRYFQFATISIILLVLLSCKKQQIAGSILLVNGTLYDGSLSLASQKDVLIKDDRILWIGDASKMDIQADTTLDITGLVISPGFIDIHAHGNPLETPAFENFLRMGVTSIALGMDGGSIRYAELAEWAIKLDSTKLGVNILPFIGHGSLREESGINLNPEPSEAVLDSMTHLLSHALEWGCWGLSMGLEYFPGYFATEKELVQLSQEVGKQDAIITSHIRNEDDDQLFASLLEMAHLTEYCDVNISHLKSVYGKGGQRAKEILDFLNQHSRLTADIYPYTASYTGIGILFPEWARNPKTFALVKKQRRKELLDFLANKIKLRNGPEATLFGSGPYKGKNLAQLEKEFKRTAPEILADIIGPYGASAAYFIMNEELQNTLIKHPKTMIASDGSPSMFHPRGYGTFAKIIEEFVMRDSILTLNEAIYKMSAFPAKVLKLTNRGAIKEGYYADLLIFDPLAVRNLATYDSPHEKAIGFEYVMVNGKWAVLNEYFTPNFGRLIKKTTRN